MPPLPLSTQEDYPTNPWYCQGRLLVHVGSLKDQIDINVGPQLEPWNGLGYDMAYWYAIMAYWPGVFRTFFHPVLSLAVFFSLILPLCFHEERMVFLYRHFYLDLYGHVIISVTSRGSLQFMCMSSDGVNPSPGAAGFSTLHAVISQALGNSMLHLRLFPCSCCRVLLPSCFSLLPRYNSWIHVAITWDGLSQPYGYSTNKLSLYLNGEMVKDTHGYWTNGTLQGLYLCHFPFWGPYLHYYRCVTIPWCACLLCLHVV